MPLFFGYGSLLSAQGINEHKFDEHYEESDLKEAVLHGYKREWNAREGDDRYLGLVKKQSSSTNGVIFNVKPKHTDAFKISEGVPKLYTVVEVGSEIVPRQNEKVFTLVTKHPSSEGEIHEGYSQQVGDALMFRSDKFQKEFHRETRLK